ncbi:MAG: GAF domain-containing protein [Candidatus Delongbacteria bacterium]|nr:GAF domain-containing protein [Candidatus Delongbacteria bacterium]
MKAATYTELLEQVRTLCQQDRASAPEAIVALLHQRLEGWDWVGWYLTDPADPRMLVLGPYRGAATDHTHIPFGRGICGQAAERAASIVVLDVSQEENYLACSSETRSEIVVPLLHEGRVIGQIDVDSHRAGHFGEPERLFLEELCRIACPVFLA